MMTIQRSAEEIESFHKRAFPGASTMQGVVTDESESWDVAWKQNVTPWEGGTKDIQPPLKQVVESGEVSFPREGRALVPGCGRGFDTIYLASSLGLEAVGFDISTTALQAANELLQSKDIPKELAEKVRFEAGDFFKYEVEKEQDKFEVIYDYTFFVAIRPPTRPLWGSQMQKLVKSGGYLITLMFPVSPEPYAMGPPFYSTFDHYVDVLGGSDGKGGAKGWEVVYDKVPDPETLSEVHKGKDRIVVWKRL